MSPFYYIIGICIIFIILARRQKIHEPFYTFFIPEIVAPEDPYPEYITDPNARSLMRFYPEIPKAVFWLWDAPDQVVNPWEWLRPFFAWMLSVLPLNSLQFKRTDDIKKIIQSVSQNQNHMALLPSWSLFDDFSKNRNDVISSVMNLFSYTIFAIVPYNDITNPRLQFDSSVFTTGTKWAVGPQGGLSDFIARRLKNIWFIKEEYIGEIAGTTGPIIINNTWEQCFEQFQKGLVDGMFWCDVSPFPLWQKTQDTLPKQSFILIPTYLDQNEILYASAPFLQKSFLRLENYDKNYLPMRVGPRLYWAWNDAFESIQFPAVWIANPSYSRKDIYLWLYQFMNQPRWRKDTLLLQSQWTQARAFYFAYNIPIHPGTEQYRINFGLDSRQQQGECVLYAGSRQCPIENPLGPKEIPPAFQPARDFPI